ncbi:MAG: sulfotransferase, partial [Bacteroidetes bacterium]|nr:sulfotransferase [Bacteroidota bacterium]
MSAYAMKQKFIFLAGHHRSGTSLLHEIIREHPLVSGFSQTGVPEDEGQHLQSVYKPAKLFGGPGRYIFDRSSHMNEWHPLATDESANAILAQWQKYYDPECPFYVEKSPPNLIRSRFLQRLFPGSSFIVILRHPVAVALATQKWSKTSIQSLVEHTLRGYEIFTRDMPLLGSVYVIRYGDFVRSPQTEVDKIFDFLSLSSIAVKHEVRSSVNDEYFALWRNHRKGFSAGIQFPLNKRLEIRAN